MKQLILAVTIFFTFMTFSFSQTNAETQNEQEAIKRLIQTCYIEGMANNGDFEKMNIIFHPDFIMTGLSKEKKMWKWNYTRLQDYYETEKSKGNIPLTEDNKITAKYITIDVIGYLALVKLEIYHGTELAYIDYLNLFKFEDGWKIISKTFYNVPE